MNTEKLIINTGAFLIVAVGIGAIALLLALPTMWTWNCVMPYLFGFKEIGFWHAFSLNILANTLIRNSLTAKKAD